MEETKKDDTLETIQDPPPGTPRTMRRSDYLLAACIAFGVIIIDQAIKFSVKTTFCLHESLEVTSWFHLNFTENEGMAWGMSPLGTVWLTLFRVLTIGLFIWILHKAIVRAVPRGLVVCIALIIAGALGNIIDNCFYGLIFSESTPFAEASIVPFGDGYGSFLGGHVVDMFYFPLFTWPDWVPLLGGEVFFNAIFNFADAAISCATIAILLFYSRYVFYGKE